MPFPTKLSVGQPIEGFPVDSWNWIISSIQQLQAERTIGGAEGLGRKKGYLTVDVLNTTGAEIDRFRPVSFSRPASDLTQDVGRHTPPVMEGVAPANDKALLIYETACPPGQVRPAAITGLMLAWVDIKDADNATTCGIEEGATTLLTSGVGSIPIKWFEKQFLAGTKTGPQWALVLLGGGGGGTVASDAHKFGICYGTEEDSDEPIAGAERKIFNQWPANVQNALRDAINAQLPEGFSMSLSQLGPHPVIKPTEGRQRPLREVTIEINGLSETYLVPTFEEAGGAIVWRGVPCFNFVPPEITADHVLGLTDNFVTEEGCP